MALTIKFFFSFIDPRVKMANGRVSVTYDQEFFFFSWKYEI